MTITARIFAGAFVAGVVYLFALTARPDSHFFSRPFIEDAFYSLSVARTLGHGGGISIDGVSPTNGVQPLICFLYAPAFAVAGDDLPTALRIVVGLQVVLAGLCALAVAWLTSIVLRESSPGIPSRRDVFWIVAGTIMVSYSLLTHLMNGLETSLAAAFVFASLAVYIERIARRRDAPLSEYARLGCLLGLGVLARIDVAILAVAIAGWHVLRSRREPDRRHGVSGAATIGIVSLLVSLPWWLYNVIVFGHLMPTSGLAQQDLLTNRVESIDLVVRGISNALLLVVHAPGDLDGIGAYAGLVAAAAVALVAFAMPTSRPLFDRALGTVRAAVDVQSLAPFAAFVLTLAVYYTFFFGAPHFIPRYLMAMWLAITVAVILALAALWCAMRAGGAGRKALGILCVVALLGSLAARSRSFANDTVYQNVLLHARDWINQHAAPTDRVGMFQSGTTGFLDPRVTNLDGKVNPRALAALRSGNLARFVDSAAFDYIIDIEFYTQHIFRDARLRALYRPVDSLPFGFVVWRRKSSSELR